MPTIPQITGPDGVARGTLIFSTTLPNRFFTGTVSSDTVEVQVSIRGGGFTSDPDYVSFDGESFTIPNPNSFPEGLSLVAGENSIRVKSISTSGLVSPNAEALVTLVQEADLGVITTPPTNVMMTRLDGAVKIAVDGIDDEDVQGYNFYASQFEGGGASGYSLLNPEPITASETVEHVDEITSFDADAEIATTPGGDPAADPLFYRLVGSQIDEDDVALQTDFTQSVEVAEAVSNVRASVTLSSIRTVSQYSFNHRRNASLSSTPSTIANGEFAATPDYENLYYVVTAVYYDPSTNTEVESPFSAEVVGSPIRVSTVSGSLPSVSRQDQMRSMAVSVLRSRPEVRLDAGSVLADTVLEPTSTEIDRVRFLVDFAHRSQSFSDLLAIDDPTNSGESIAVQESNYKLALKKATFLTNDDDVQALVDQQFDQLANRVGRPRRTGRAARAEVTFSTGTRPTRSVTFNLGFVVGAGSVNFNVTKPVTVSVNNVASFYDPVSGRYRVTTSVQAAEVGTTGNVAAGQIRTMVSSQPSWSVSNSAAAFGGRDQETNRELAEAAQSYLAALDVGTAQGYNQTSSGIPGVLGRFVVGANHPLMQRDLDSNGSHVGGKVDVWVRGVSEATVTDTFAFNYVVKQNVHFTVVGDPEDYLFEAQDPDLSADNPIAEVLDFPDSGLEFINATTGESFDITGVTIVSYNRVQLSTSVAQPSVDLEDVVLGAYRYRDGRDFVLTRQPVSAINSVTGAVTGTLDESFYTLNHPDAPLLRGRSSLAQDFLRVTQGTDTNGNTIPSGSPVTVTSESHVLIGENPEPLDNLGANYLSIAVLSEDRVTTYKGPNDPSGTSDYTIILGSDTEAVAIQRTTTSSIPSGATVVVDYTHEENFTVSYTTNLVVSTAQDNLDPKRHGAADVLAKEFVRVPVDITATILLKSGQEQSDVDPLIRTNLINYFATVSNRLTPSNVTTVIERTTGVASVVTPVSKVVRQEGSQVVRESITTAQAGDVTYVAAWSTPTVSVWLLEDQLSAAVADAGGPETEFKGVFRNDTLLGLRTSNPELLGTTKNASYFIGVNGLSIPGFSDDTTLDGLGFETATEKSTERKRLTSSRVLVTTSVDESPTDFDFAATYIVGSGTGPLVITLLDVEELVEGNFDFTYDEEPT